MFRHLERIKWESIQLNHWSIAAKFYWWWTTRALSTFSNLYNQHKWYLNIDGLVQDCSLSGALAMKLLQSCTKPSVYAITWWTKATFWTNHLYERALWNLIRILSFKTKSGHPMHHGRYWAAYIDWSIRCNWQFPHQISIYCDERLIYMILLLAPVSNLCVMDDFASEQILIVHICYVNQSYLVLCDFINSFDISF